jgi:nucleotide-binding universal stress UspA family protein
VLPGSTAERLLHGAPCAVAVVPNGYGTTTHPAIRRIGVAYNATDEARAAVAAAAEAARGLGAELEVIGVVAADDYGSPALMGGPSYHTLRDDIEEHVQKSLDAVVKGLPADVHRETIRLSGDPADQIAARSGNVDLMVMGSRGYGPVRAVLAGGVSGRVVREAQCPVIVVPRGVQAPLSELFGAAAAARV